MRKLICDCIWGLIVLLCFASWGVGFWLEWQILSQPDRPTEQFTRPIHLKGVVRYATPNQEYWNALALYGFLGSWAVGIYLGVSQMRRTK
jgi:hypothetical protein